MRRDKSGVYQNQDDENGVLTARGRGRQLKNSMYLEEGSIHSGIDTLGDKKLLDKIRCETPPEFIESGLGQYDGMMKMQH